MNRFIIKKYINKITKDDIVRYAYKQNINISDRDVQVIYYYIKHKSHYFFDGHYDLIMDEIKDKVSPIVYQKIRELYDEYKNKI